MTDSSNTTTEIGVSGFGQIVALNELAGLFTIEDENFDYDATATYNVALNKLLYTFGFKADNYVNLATDVANGNMTDLKFYTVNPVTNLADSSFAENLTVIENNIATTDVYNNALANSQQNISQDYFRYFALKIFGIVQGVNFIANENEIMDDLKTQLNNAWNTGILTNILDAQSRSNSNNATDIDMGGYYYDNSEIRGSNQCACQYFFYELMKNDPERFALSSSVDPVNGSPTGLLVPGANEYGQVCSIPFVVGDKLSFPMTIKANPNQKSYVTGNGIPDRVYKIQLVVV